MKAQMISHKGHPGSRLGLAWAQEVKMRRFSLATVALGAGLAFAGTNPASADTTYDLTFTNSTDIGTGPFATVVVSLTNSTHATVTYTADAGYSLVDTNIADANVNATSWTISGFTGYTLTPTSNIDSGSGNVDGFKVLNQTTTNGPANTLLSAVSFVLTDTSGTWADSASVLAANAQGFAVAAHVAFDANCALGVACTGFVSVPGPLTGAGLPGLIAACGALIALARRRRRDGLAHA
jgi:hypothetical protein